MRRDDEKARAPSEAIAAFLGGCRAFTGVDESVLREVAAASTERDAGEDEAEWTMLGSAPFVVRHGSLLVRDHAGRTVDLLTAHEFHSPSEGERFEPLEPVRLVVLPEHAPDFAWSAPASRLRAMTSRPPRPQEEDHQTGPVRSLMSAPVVAADADESCRDVATLMRDRGISSVVVRDGDAIGIVTDRDLCDRLVAGGGSPDAPVRSIATFPARTLQAGTLVVEALMEMLRLGIHHFPVAEDGRVVGMLSADDLLRQRTSSPLHLRAQLAEAADVSAVAAAARRTADMAAALLASGTGGAPVARVISAVTDRIVARLIELAVDELGGAPAPYGWLAFGSLARQEQTLHTDQDTGLLLPDGLGEDERDWFGRLGGRVTGWLEECGFALCGGGVMASEAGWRRDVSGWRRRFDGWMTAPGQEALLGAEIAFDLRMVAGDLDAEALLRPSIRAAADRPLFLLWLARAASRHRPPLGFLGRFTVERSGAHAGTFDVKAGAMMPIADIARLHTLARGGPELTTDDRLAGAVAVGQVSADLGSTLRAGYALALRIRLEGQLSSRLNGTPMSNRVDPDALPTFERAQLKETFRAIRTAQESIETAYRTSAIG